MTSPENAPSPISTWPHAPVHRFVGPGAYRVTARALNRLDQISGRKVWYQYWDSAISYDGSFFARLKYVHRNPEHHEVIGKAENDRWCSAAWFARSAPRPLFKTVMSMKIDRVVIPDAF